MDFFPVLIAEVQSQYYPRGKKNKMNAENVDTEISKGWNFTDTEQTVILLIPDDKHFTNVECIYFLLALSLSKDFENHNLFTYFSPQTIVFVVILVLFNPNNTYFCRMMRMLHPSNISLHVDSPLTLFSNEICVKVALSSLYGLTSVLLMVWEEVINQSALLFLSQSCYFMHLKDKF